MFTPRGLLTKAFGGLSGLEDVGIRVVDKLQDICWPQKLVEPLSQQVCRRGSDLLLVLLGYTFEIPPLFGPLDLLPQTLQNSWKSMLSIACASPLEPPSGLASSQVTWRTSLGSVPPIHSVCPKATERERNSWHADVTCVSVDMTLHAPLVSQNPPRHGQRRRWGAAKPI